MTRDTDSDWTVIGQNEPWYGVLATERYLSANMTAERIEEFYASGVAEIDRVVGTLERHFGPFAPTTSLDFGSGVGRLTLAMAKRSTKCYGLDVSSGMIAQAIGAAKNYGIGNVEFVTQLPPDIKVDWINSFIVFQHIPPARGFQILDELLGRLKPGGVVSVQLTYYHDSRHVMTLMRDLAAYAYDGESLRHLGDNAVGDVGSMSMYDYDLNKLFKNLCERGLSDCFIEQTDHGGCHGVWVYGKRS